MLKYHRHRQIISSHETKAVDFSCFFQSCTASKIREGKVVEILGDTYGLGDTCRKFFEKNGGFHLYDIESMNISDTPQTITFCSAEG